jgi:hypothetical protein
MKTGNLTTADLRIAYWGSLAVWGSTAGVMSTLSTVLLLDVWWDLRVSVEYAAQLVVIWLILLILWSEFLLGSIYVRSSVLPTYGRWKGWVYGLSHFGLFILVYLVIDRWTANYFRQLDSGYVTRVAGYSMARVDLVEGILCFYSHLFVRSMIMLTCIIEDGLQERLSTESPKRGDGSR